MAGTDLSNNIGKWVLAGVLAGAALLGAVILVGIVTLALQLPSWIQVVSGIVLALGAAVFAWLLASAFGSTKR